MTGTVADMEIIENLAIAARRGKKRGLSWGVKADERIRYRQMLAEFDLGLEDRMSSKVETSLGRSASGNNTPYGNNQKAKASPA